MIWLLPLAALACLDVTERWPWPSLAILGATMVTPITFPSLFHDYGTGINLFEAIVLLLRNLVLILVWVRLVIEMLATDSQPRRPLIQWGEMPLPQNRNALQPLHFRRTAPH